MYTHIHKVYFGMSIIVFTLGINGIIIKNVCKMKIVCALPVVLVSVIVLFYYMALRESSVNIILKILLLHVFCRFKVIKQFVCGVMASTLILKAKGCRSNSS